MKINNLFREKIHSLDTLNKKGLVVIDAVNTPIVTNKLYEILDNKKITVSDLSQLTGINKQSLINVAKGNVLPNIAIAMKICYVLNLSIFEVFNFTDTAWIQPYTISNKKIYIDMINLELMEYSLVRKIIKEDNFEYYDSINGIRITKSERNILFKEYTSTYLNNVCRNISCLDNSLNSVELKSIAKNNLEIEFNSRYKKIYCRVAKIIQPCILK